MVQGSFPIFYPLSRQYQHSGEDHHRGDHRHEESRRGGPSAALIGNLATSSLLLVIFGSVLGALVIGLCLRMVYDRFYPNRRRTRSDVQPLTISSPFGNPSPDENRVSDPFSTSNSDSNLICSSNSRVEEFGSSQIELQSPNQPWNNKAHKRISSLGRGIYSQNQPSRISMNPECYDSRRDLNDTAATSFRHHDQGENEEEAKREYGRNQDDSGRKSSSQININDPPTYAKSQQSFWSSTV